MRKMEEIETDIINMPERRRQIMEFSKMSQQDFAAKLGISAASLSSIFNGRTRPTNNHTVAIHKAFPKISLNWLLFGEGEMNETQGDVQVSLAANVVPTPSQDLFDGVANVRNDTSNISGMDMRRKESACRLGPSVEVNNIDIKKRQIKEIRVFYDDGTYESFVPQK